MKKWFLIGVIALAAAAAVYFYVMNKPHRSIRDEDGLAVTADSLFLAFQHNETAANAAYLNKVLRVDGKVKSVERNTEGKQVVVLETGDIMFGINCTMDKEQDAKEGDAIVVKGICTGYLADVVMNQCVIQNNR